MTEEALAELERLLTEMLAWAEARGKELYQLHAEVARLREVLLPLLDEIDTGGDLDYHLRTEGHAERLNAAFSTPADDWLERKLEDGRRWSKAWKACARHWRDVCYPYTNLCPVSGCPLYPTDNWLEQHDEGVREQAMAEANATMRIAQMQHDAEVRREERERCAKEVEALHACDCGPHWTERGLHSPTCLWAECQGIAADLRESTE